MSSVRGASSRGRGRGSTQQSAARGGGASNTRGRGFSTDPVRGNAAPRGSFGQASRQNATRPPRAPYAPRANVSSSQTPAFGGAKTTGNPQDRFQALTKARERERAHAINQGLIADPEKPRSLADAITPVGTCQDMCAEYERAQRIVQNDVWDEETDPHHEDRPDERRMVKKFKRSAAGIEEQLPSDLRPPPVLRRTCNYLFDDMIGNARSLAKVHHFVWDRTRAIRNDLSIQQVQKREDLRIAVDCYERIARFHIMSLHQLALPERPYSKYDWHQEREQLDRTLLSLMQFYDDSRGRIEFSNEAEFRAYCVILQLQDPIPDLEDRIQCWPRHIIQDSRVLKALDLYMAACNITDSQGPLKPRTNHLIARQDWQRFWTLVASKEVSYLMACAAEVYFNLVRRTVLNALFCTSRQRGDKAEKDKKTTEWTIDVLCELLAFDNGDDVYTYCERFGFSFNAREDGQHYLDLSSVGDRTLPEPKAGMPKQLKSNLVEDKRFGRTLPAVINGMTVKRAQDAGMVMEQDEEDEIDMEDIGDLESEQQGKTNGIESSDTFDDGDSLFLPETRKPSMFQSQTSASLANGARETNGGPSSTFSGLSTGFNFGKPSPFGDNTGAKSQMSGSNVPKFDFLNPTAGNAITGAGSSSFSEMPPTTTTDTATGTKPAPSRLFGPSGTSESIFSKPAALPPPTAQPMFSFSAAAAPPKSTSLDETLSPKSNPSPLFTAPASAATNHETSQSQPMNHFTFDQPTGTPAAPMQRQPSRSPETNSSQPHFTAAPTAPTSTLNPHPSTPGLGSGTRKLSSSRDHRPEKPSPLSHSFTAGDDSSAITEGHPGESFTAKQPPQGLFSIRKSQVTGFGAVVPENRPVPSSESEGGDFDAIVARIAEEFYTDPIRGILKQYIDYNVRQTIRGVQSQIENERLAEVVQQYNRFRLHKKFGKRWRDLFWQKRLAKSGRERRERRQRRLQQRSSQEIDGGSLFNANTSGGHSQAGSVDGAENFGVRQSVEVDMYGRPIIGQQARHAMDAFHQVHAGAKRPTSSHGPEDVSRARQHSHKRMKSTSHVDERGRIAKPSSTSHPNSDLLKRSSFLGFSPPHDGSNNKNTTKSNYFKLKAMGVHRVDESITPRGTKRPLSALGLESTQTSPPALRSPSLFASNFAKPSDRTLMPPPSSTPARTPISNDDEDLFTRLKAARENLMDSTTFYKSEIGKDDELRRSLNSSHSSNEFESPSMARARLEAQMRASRGPSESGASSNRRDVPAYRLRESKFLPRESYGRAIERAKEIRESRSRETSRPESPQNHVTTQHETPAATAAPTFGVQNYAPDQSSFTMASTKGPNGFSHKQDDQPGLSAFGPTSTSTSFVRQSPATFSKHTTEMSSENPFLRAPVGNTFTGFNPEQVFAFNPKQQDDSGRQDYTIRPSQINQALSNSFGSSHGYGANQLLSVPQDMNTPPQQDSYLQSQTISLLSDDEDDAPPSTQQPRADSTGDTEATQELFNESSDEYESAQTNGHSNTYALLARQEYDDEDQQSFDSQTDDEDGYDEEDARQPNGYADSEEEDEDAIDGDIDDDETEDVGDDGDASVSEYDEEDEHMEHGQWRQPGEYDQSWATQPPKGSALEGVGNTAEEAIELSD